jgi:hypothetical protein
MCIQLHIGPPTRPGQMATNTNEFNILQPRPLLADKLQSPNCLRWLSEAGVPLDYIIRFHISDAGSGFQQGEAGPSPSAHDSVPVFLRTDDRAHRSTRFGHPIAAQSDQGSDARQHRAVDGEGQGHRRSADGPLTGSEPRASSVVPSSVVPSSVVPGSVVPGSTATPCSEPHRQGPSSRACFGFG